MFCGLCFKNTSIMLRAKYPACNANAGKLNATPFLFPNCNLQIVMTVLKVFYKIKPKTIPPEKPSCLVNTILLKLACMLMLPNW